MLIIRPLLYAYSDFPWSKSLEEKLHDVFNIPKLRPLQLPTMNVTLSGKDCMIVMPTGAGKSLCYQLPALLSEGGY
jgi:ATP-dependent DNA helicase Q1